MKGIPNPERPSAPSEATSFPGSWKSLMASLQLLSDNSPFMDSYVTGDFCHMRLREACKRYDIVPSFTHRQGILFFTGY